jgi:hypothetical protein
MKATSISPANSFSPVARGGRDSSSLFCPLIPTRVNSSSTIARVPLFSDPIEILRPRRLATPVPSTSLLRNHQQGS